MASPFIKYKGQQEQARVKETSSVDPQSLPSLVLCVGADGLNIGRITTHCEADGTRNQKLDPNYIQLPKWNAAIDKKLPMFQGEAACPKNLDIETTLSLSQPGVGEENYARNKSVVLALPAQTSLASSSHGPNLGHKVNDQSKLVFMGCINCNVSFFVPVVPDPRCPKCREKSFWLDAFLNFPRKRARMN